MPSLADTLRGRDLGFLKMIAGCWGLDLSAPDAATFLPQLVSAVLSHPFQRDVIDALPPEAQDAVQALASEDGRLPWPLFIRRFGEVRPYGPGKRDKERPDLHPVSPAEWLWYRGLVGRAFLKDPGDPEPLEYAYIPDDLLGMLEPLVERGETPPGRPATPAEYAHPQTVNDRILDWSCSLLAWRRQDLPLEQLDARGWTAGSGASWGAGPKLLAELLHAARLLDADMRPLGEDVRAFLEAPRGEALRILVYGWTTALYFNELRLMPGLVCEGEWMNDPLRARQTVMQWVARVPAGKWWSLPAFVKAIRERDPDFQRPAGDYDSWFIRRENSETYLRGFASWDEVDGALVRFILSGPMHWLGFVDLARSSVSGEISAFRLSAWAEALFNGSAPDGLSKEEGKLKLTSTGKILLPRLFPRAARYQIARFCAWEEESSDEFRYRAAPAALQRATSQGLKPRQLIALLRRHAENGAVPPALIQSLERWESNGTQASIEPALLLRLASPEILTVLKKSRAARYIDEELTATAVLIRRGSEEKVLEALGELGYLGDIRLGSKDEQN